LELGRESNRTLRQQIYDALRRAILDGKLPAGSAVPSTRALAASLRVSRNTILWAYEALLADGLLVTRKGSGTKVRVPETTHRPFPERQAFDLWAALRAAHYPATAQAFADPDGNPLYIHR